VTPRIPKAAIAAAFPGLKLSFVGRGGQSDAWRGEDGGRVEILRVLVKVEPGRLGNEVAALTTVANPHLMRFYGLGEVDHGGQRFPVIRGEFIAGGTVQDAIEANTWPSIAETFDCAKGVAEALVPLHARDIVHRDIKPANIAVRNGNWDDAVVLDLGYLRNLVGPPLTVYPTHIGTIAFMAPEQLRLEPAGLRSDIYALGITIFFLLARKHPFVADTDGPTLAISEVLTRMEDASWPDWSRLPAATPGGLRDLLARCWPTSRARGRTPSGR
jgi:serine/threonine protein kinase